MFRQISCKFSKEIISLWKKSISGETFKNEQILGQILETSKMILNDTSKVHKTLNDIKITYLEVNETIKNPSFESLFGDPKY